LPKESFARDVNMMAVL